MADQITGERETGVVKWFNDEKGFGFITPDSGAQDLFAHFRAIKVSISSTSSFLPPIRTHTNTHCFVQKQGFRSLKEGERVSFIVEQGNKALQASEIESAA